MLIFAGISHPISLDWIKNFRANSKLTLKQKNYQFKDVNTLSPTDNMFTGQCIQHIHSRCVISISYNHNHKECILLISKWFWISSLQLTFKSLEFRTVFGMLWLRFEPAHATLKLHKVASNQKYWLLPTVEENLPTYFRYGF